MPQPCYRYLCYVTDLPSYQSQAKGIADWVASNEEEVHWVAHVPSPSLLSGTWPVQTVACSASPSLKCHTDSCEHDQYNIELIIIIIGALSISCTRQIFT